MLRACSQVTVCFTSVSFACSICQAFLRKRSKEMEVTRRRDGPVASFVNKVPAVTRRNELQVRLADKGLAFAQQPRPFASNGLPYLLKRTTVILSSGKTINEIHNKRSLMVSKDSCHSCNRGLMLTDGVPLNLFAEGRWWVFRRLDDLVSESRVINPCFISCNKALRMFNYFIRVTCQMHNKDRKTNRRALCFYARFLGTRRAHTFL
jgi:hypothetical protein